MNNIARNEILQNGAEAQRSLASPIPITRVPKNQKTTPRNLKT
jgi:hypothetical protein